VVRALEVIRLTGKPFSAQRARWTQPSSFVPRPSSFFCGLSRSADDLRTRIDARVEAMFGRGLVEETEGLVRHGLAKNRTAMQAIGYRQVIEHLRGEHSLADTITLVKQRTRQFAKRQMAWFRRQLDLTWVEVRPDEDAETMAERLIRIRATGETDRAEAAPQGG